MTLARAISFWALFEVLFIGLMQRFPGIPDAVMGMLGGAVLGGAMYAVTRLYVKHDTLTLGDLGLVPGAGSVRRLLVSLLVGMAVFGVFYLVYLALTPVRFAWVEQPNWLEALVFGVLTFLLLSLMEEIVFRGYLLRKLESAVGMRAAIYASSVLFGLYHGLSLESITGPAVWGLWYAVLLYWSRGLAVPIGFHAGVNFTQALFNQKQWVPGIWEVELVERSTPFTIG